MDELDKLDQAPWPVFLKALISADTRDFERAVRQAMREVRRVKIRRLRSMWAHIKAWDKGLW